MLVIRMFKPTFSIQRDYYRSTWFREEMVSQAGRKKTINQAAHKSACRPARQING
jgi:hypothetical protein